MIKKLMSSKIFKLRLRMANGAVPDPVWRPRTGESPGCKFQSEGQQAQNQEDVKFQCESEGGKKARIQLKTVREKGMVSLSVLSRLQLIGWGPS